MYPQAFYCKILLSFICEVYQLSADKKTVTRVLSDSVSTVSTVLPLSLATGVCSGYGAFGGIVCAVCACLCSFAGGTTPSYLVFLIASTAVASHGLTAALAGTFVAAVITVIGGYCRCDKLKGKASPALKGAVTLATAFSLTALQTTNYFGIGAGGASVVEIITDYRSLGFHANWRGVFYGTVVMVIMITFPRAFKKFCTKLSPSFIALAVTLVLNLLLNPGYRATAINEVGAYRACENMHCFDLSLLTASDIPFILLFGIALAFAMLYSGAQHNECSCKKLFTVQSAGNAVCAAAGGVPFATFTKVSRVKPVSGIIAAAVCALLFACGVFERMPVHSLAVVIIVGAWQSVDWHAVAVAFKGGAKSTLILIVWALLIVFAPPAVAVAIIGLFVMIKAIRS